MFSPGIAGCSAGCRAGRSVSLVTQKYSLWRRIQQKRSGRSGQPELSFFQGALQGGQAACVLAGRAHGNAQPFREPVTRHGPDDYPKALEPLEGSLAISNAYEDEVGRRRN